jgi:hypothetical protein
LAGTARGRLELREQAAALVVSRIAQAAGGAVRETDS